MAILVVGLGSLPEASVPQSPVTIRVAPVRGGEATVCSGGGVLEAFPVLDGEATPAPASLRWTLEPPVNEVSPELDPTLPWKIRFRGDGCWAPEQALAPREAETPTTLHLPLWPAGRLTGKLVAPTHPSEEGTPLARVELGFESVPRPLRSRGTHEVPTSTTVCPVDEGIWDCPLPATPLDLRLEAPGYVPHYLWGIDVRAGETRDVGTLQLATGGSLVGWVRGDGVDEVVTVELAPEVFYGDATATGRLAKRGRRTQANERGFFQLQNLAEGSYVLVARAGEERSPLRVAPLEIDRGREHVLPEVLILQPKSSLAVSVLPPVDPYSEPWRLTLQRHIPLSTYVEDVDQGIVQGDGKRVVRQLDHGTYVLAVADSRGSKYTRKRFDVGTGETELVIEIPVVPVAGRISWGDEAIATQLFFRGLDGRRITLESDEEGYFEGYLAREGDWRVAADPIEAGVKPYIGDVHVERKPGQRHAWIDLALANTHIRGRVVDLEGRPMEPALVSVLADGVPELQVWVDEEGGFEILGLFPGTKQIRGQARPHRDSGFVTYDLEEDREGPLLDLVVSDQVRVRLVIVAPGGRVAGALVRYSDPSFPNRSEIRAGPSGELSLFVTPESRALDVVVRAPGFPVKMARVELPTEITGALHVGLAPMGGKLRFQPRSGGFLLHNGVTLPWWHVLSPPSGSRLRGLDPVSGNLSVEVEAGEYALCPTPKRSPACRSGYLPVGGELDLSHSREEEPPEKKTRVSTCGMIEA